jgi:glucosyl-3-phosphoglycerate synthase
MSDFAQSGLITTLQRLNETHLDALESELIEVAAERRIGLVLPCHASELERPALTSIARELSGAAWLGEVIVAMNGPDEAAREEAEALFAPLPQDVRILWQTDAAPGEQRVTGKGENVRAAFELLCEERRCEIIATQDCDVVSFRRRDLARLCYAVAHPALGFRFAKAYYARATDRLYGRVTRLFFAPLLHAWVRTAGHLPLLSFLLSFRYPLAGEIALTRELAATLAVAPGWTLELATLCEVFRAVDPREVCQVDGGRGYDHKHQPAMEGLVSMAREIAQELHRQLEVDYPSTKELRGLIPQAYAREADLAARRSAALARINQLSFDETAERELAREFRGVLD